MLRIFHKFFEFSGEQKKNFYTSIILSIFYSIFEALKILAIAVVLRDMLHNNVENSTIILSFSIILVSIIGCAFLKNKMTM